ncbi:MAG: PIN domain-containing protein, partial [Dehalococcoidia bacterium]
QLATFVMAWESGRFQVVCSRELADEYERVLASPPIAQLIYPELLRAFRDHLTHDIEWVGLPFVPRLCRDPDDDKVIATALFGGVSYLVSADHDLHTPEIVQALRLAGIAIVTIDALIAILDDERGTDTADNEHRAR